MPTLTLTIRFPTGQYQAHDGLGNAEWPPAPARILTALLAAAYRSHDPGAVTVARSLFHLDPPRLHTPPATERHTPTGHYVPVDHDFTVHTTKGTTRVTALRPGTLLKPPERGTVTGPDTVTIHWDQTHLTGADLDTLDTILNQVTYLGRPTSPVIIDRTPHHSPDETHTIWEPNPDGHTRLAIATPTLLAALDYREEQRELAGTTGVHPRLGTRPTAPYARRDPAPDTTTVRPATHAETLAACTTLTYYPTPHAAPADIASVMEALLQGAGADAFIVPAYGNTGQAGRFTPRLFGVAAHAVDPTPRTYLRDRDLVDLGYPRPELTHLSAQRAVRAAWSSSKAWTTTAPLSGARDDLITLVTNLAARQGARIVDATTHDMPRVPNAPDTGTHPRQTHLSLLFDRYVTGPLNLTGQALAPFDPDPNAEH